MSYEIHTSVEQPINKHFILMERHLYNPDVVSCGQQDIVVFVENGYGRVYWSEEDIARLHQQSAKLLETKNACALLRQCKDVEKEYWKVANSVLKELANIPKRYRLAQLYDKYIEAFRNVLALYPASGPKATYAVEKRLLFLLKERFGDKTQEYLEILTREPKNYLLLDELKDWLALLNDNDEKKLIEHMKKYSIILPNIFSETEALAWAHERKRQKSSRDVALSIKELEKSRKKSVDIQKNIFKQCSCEIRFISIFIQELGGLRLLLKRCWNGEAYHMLPLYESIARITRCRTKDLCMFYTWRDIHTLLHNDIPLPNSVLDGRKRSYLMHFYRDSTHIYHGKKALKKKNELLMPYMPNNDATIKGTPASSGKTKGIAIVVKTDNPLEFQKIAMMLPDDAILVTGMTNPAMTIIMDKVKGIITDEGGIVCHAAIISRELRIPCIVGTKIATSVLKSGEKIILDADNGTVTRHNEKF